MSAKRLPFAPVHESSAEGDQSVFGEQSAEPVSRVGSEPRRPLARGKGEDPPGVRRRQAASVARFERSTPLDVGLGNDGDDTKPARSQVAAPDEVIDTSRADAQPVRGLRDGEMASWRDSINHSNVRVDDAIDECKTLAVVSRDLLAQNRGTLRYVGATSPGRSMSVGAACDHESVEQMFWSGREVSPRHV